MASYFPQHMPLSKYLSKLVAVALLTCLTAVVRAVDIKLPSLGDATSGVVSPQQEYELGQTWLRLYRSRVPTSSDPLLYDYIAQLLNNLAQSSQLQNRQLELIVVENPTMNAFAVPGGVVGVHTGLFLFAENEAQLASVLSHELAHLSQRHFARGVEQRSKSSIPNMAALLGSLVIAATAGGDAGLAAISATQAAAQSAQLRFSRQNEQEADRIGMLTMVNAGFDPEAVPQMFESMLRSSRYNRRPPEFLLTHPVTESRIADSRNRASRYPKKSYVDDNVDFHLMRSRIRYRSEVTPQQAVKRFRNEIQGDTLSREASQYGLVLALTGTGELAQARKELQALLKKQPDKIPYIIADADIDAASKNYQLATDKLLSALKFYPENHPLTVRYAEILMAAGNYAVCEAVLVEHSERRPKDDYVWYLLAEVHGLAGNILGVHRARAEYFILNGVYDKAQRQLENALKFTRNNFRVSSLVRERIKDVQKMREAEL